MSDKQPEHPTVKIAGIVGAFVFIIVVILATVAPEQLSVIGWIVVPLALMGVGLGWIGSRRRE